MLHLALPLPSIFLVTLVFRSLSHFEEKRLGAAFPARFTSAVIALMGMAAYLAQKG